MTKAPIHPNECMVRTGILIGLSSGFAILGHWQIAAGVGVFAAVQILTLIAQGAAGTGPSKA